jgi:very-short-patch-repair endonuclease
VAQRFGPINVEGGARRLNVLFTRAKERLVLYSSMRPSDIIAQTGTSVEADGRLALREYLAYARGESLQRPLASSRPPGSDFEIAVAEGLRRHGYACHAQLGFAGFFIDLAVLDPLDPSTYLLAVECDGAPYHSTRSARDRDRLRQQVLERLGWTVHRIWSRDWYEHSDRALDRLVSALKEAQAQKSVRARRSGTSAGEARVAPPQSGGPSAPAGGKISGTIPLLKAVPAGQPRESAVPSPIRQGITEEEAREKLLDLRQSVDREAPADPTRALLRREMLDSLLREKPCTLAEFHERIPRALRERTDAAQVRLFLHSVLEILGEIAAD